MKRERKTPKRGEVWLYHPGRTIGSEMTKKRRAVVVSSDAMGKLPVKLVVPLTEWGERYVGNAWHFRIAPSSSGGLSEISAVDVIQLRSVDR